MTTDASDAGAGAAIEQKQQELNQSPSRLNSHQPKLDIVPSPENYKLSTYP